MQSISNASVTVVGDQLQVDGHALPGLTCQQQGNRYLIQAEGYTIATVPQPEIQRWTLAFLKVGSFASSQFGT